MLAECGHVPQVELPERTHALIAEFIDERRPRRRSAQRDAPPLGRALAPAAASRA